MANNYTVLDSTGATVTFVSRDVGAGVELACSVPSDGTHFVQTLFDLDSGGGTEYQLGVSLRASASGGSVELGTSANPIRTDPTGTTTQPVSGTVTANAGSNLNTSALALEAGNLATLAGGVTAAKYQVTVASALPVGANSIGNIGTVATVTVVSAVTAITNALPTGNNVIGHVIIDASSAVIGHVIVDSGTVTTVSTVTAVTTITNAVTVVGAAASGASKSGNPVQIGGVFNTTQPTVTSGQAVEVQTTNRGAQIVATGADTFNVTINAALPAGTAVIGHVIVDAGSAVIGHVILDSGTVTLVSTVTVVSAVTAITNALPAGTNTLGQVGLVPVTSGGLTIYRNLDLGSTGVNIKASAGQLYGWYMANNSSAVRYVKFYNKATAPTVGTDVPVLTIALPATSAANVEFTNGIAFGTGIGIGAVTGVADNSTANTTANDVIVNVLYK